MEKLNIYTRLQKIQSEIKKLLRSEENKFQKYFYFDELQVFRLLKPLLNNYQLVLLMSDDETKEFICEQSGNMWLVKYCKKCEVINTVDSEEKLTYYFWASALNQDPAKAKGSAETYAIKYFLSKFFLIPVKDEEDPDSHPKEEIIIPKQKIREVINNKQVQELYDLFVTKRGTDLSIQTNFLTEIDKIMVKYGMSGATNTGNFRIRLTTLTIKDYQHLINYLNKLPDTK